ncbi:MAG: MFS transporter [Chloroflexi bacterium]|nr:MFS transporter [Chloroflexota bacterium]
MVIGGDRISLRNLGTFSSFKNPVYRIFYGGMVGQMAAMNMQILTGTLLLYRLTGSAAILGVMSLANALPTLFLSLFGGIIADRVQKKYVLQVGQTASAIVSLGVALTLTLGYLSTERGGSWWILIVSSLFQGAIMGLMMPSRQAILPEIVTKEELMNAASLNVMGMNALRVLAPAAAGFLIDAWGFQAVYYTMTGTYLIAVVFTTFLPLTGSKSLSGRNALTDIKEGFQYIRRETTIILLIFFALLGVLLSTPYGLLLPIFTEDILKVGAKGMGILMSVSGIGAIIGSLTLASLPNKKRGLMMLVSSLFLGIALTGFSFSSSWSLSLALIVFVGLGQAGQMTLGGTLLQYYTEATYLGRVMSILMMQFGLISFSTFAAGLLAEGIGVQWAVGGFAIVLIFVSVLMLVFVPRLRKLD